MADQLDLFPTVRFVEPVHTYIRWISARKENRFSKNLVPKKMVLPVRRLLEAVDAVEDFNPIHYLLGGDAAVHRDDLFRDLLRLRRRGLVVDYGPDLWMLTDAGRAQLELPPAE